ncbi:MAG: DUF6442 family protein, partial [Clostridia bacterium]|nr:DUF6442 family protein [Clostridia bacterium]
AEKQDEGVEYIANKGRHYGVKAMCIIFIVLVIFNSCKGQSNYSVFAMFWMYCGFESIGKYRAGGDKTWLIPSIFCVMSSVLFFTAHIMEVL